MMEPQRKNQGVGNILAAVLLIGIAVLAGLSYLLVRQYTLCREAEERLIVSERVREELQRNTSKLEKELALQQGRFKDIAEEAEQAKAESKAMGKIRKDYESQISQIKKNYEEQISDVRNLLSVRNQLVSSLKSDIASLKTQSQIPAAAPMSDRSLLREIQGIDVRRSRQEDPDPEKQEAAGIVTLVDRSNRFVVVNLGAADGMSVGDTIQLYKAGKNIGKARIERVYHELSAAAVLSDQTLSEVQKGNQVILGAA